MDFFITFFLLDMIMPVLNGSYYQNKKDSKTSIVKNECQPRQLQDA